MNTTDKTFYQFRMHCGLAEGHAGILRVMSTAEHPNLNKMHSYLTDLETSVKILREILDEKIADRLASGQV